MTACEWAFAPPQCRETESRLTEGNQMSLANHRAWRASGGNICCSAFDGTSAPVEHVRSHCPVLIATPIAMARAAERQPGVEHAPGCSSSDGRSLRPIGRKPIAPAPDHVDGLTP